MPPYPSPGTTIAVAPPGGPQPAKKKSAIEDFISGSVNTAVQATRPAKLTLGDTPIKTFSDLIAAGWQSQKPSVDELQEYLKTLSRPAPTPATGMAAAGYVPLTPAYAFGDYVDDRDALERLLSESSSGTDLAKRLGASPADLEPLYAAAAGRNASSKELAASGDAAVEEVRTQLATDPVSADAAERRANGPGPADDLLALGTESPMTTGDLQELLLAMHGQEAMAGPENLERAKQQILVDAAAANDRVAQINEAYRAGLQGRPMPSVPQPGESTAQSQYKTAGAVSASAAEFTPIFGQLDTTETDDAILQAAGLVEQKRAEELRYQATAKLTDQIQLQEQQERELKSEQEQVDKAARTAARKEAIATAETQISTQWTDQHAQDVISSASDDEANPVVDADSKYDKLKRRFSAGAREQDIISEIFQKYDSSELTVPERRLIQAAKAAATGKIPPELKQRYLDETAEARRYVNENPEEFGG